MMVIFNLSRARLHFEENAEHARKTVERQISSQN